jgi:hypothetical protein
MDTKHASYFFLGANSEKGFHSLYDGMADRESGDYIWLIKGGPGCGKSSFMRKIGEAALSAGYAVEFTKCSGDPDSLDAVYIPEKKLCYADATSPHVMDAQLPAAGDSYLDLGRFYRRGELLAHRVELTAMNAEYKKMYARIYKLLSAAGGIEPGGVPGLITERDRAYVRRRAQGVAEREFGRPDRTRSGSEKHRFLSAVSCRGCLRLNDTLSTLCSLVYAIDNGFGLAHDYLSTLTEAAASRGLDRIVCHDPLHPERLDALILPGLSLGFAAQSDDFGPIPSPMRNVRLDAVPERSRVQQLRRKTRAAAKLHSAIMREALSALAEAKALHDKIEAVYNPHVDFEGLYNLCSEHIEAMLAI